MNDHTGASIDLADDCTVILDKEHITVFERPENGELVTRAVFLIGGNGDVLQGADPNDHGYMVTQVNYQRDGICIAEVLKVDDLIANFPDLALEAMSHVA